MNSVYFSILEIRRNKFYIASLSLSIIAQIIIEI